jgi:hypothetical protein
VHDAPPLRVLAFRLALESGDLAPQLVDPVEDRLKPGIPAESPRVTHRVGELHRMNQPLVLGSQVIQA